MSDLFGADLPIEGGDGGQFAWRDGPFLQALKAGHWILLDEVNVSTYYRIQMNLLKSSGYWMYCHF